MRMSRQPGQRVESLRSIAQALRLRLPAGHSLAELRTEAAAALSLPDIEVEREWEGGIAPDIVGWAMDRKLERYARLAADGVVTIRSTRDDRLLGRWKGELKAPWRESSDNAHFSPDGRYLTVWHHDSKQLLVLRLDETGPVVRHRGETAVNGQKMSFSPDSSILAYLQDDTRIAVVDLASGEVRYLPPADATQEFIEFAPDGRRFAIEVNRAGRYAAEVRDLATGRVERTLEHPQRVDGLAWHPDGQTLATGCIDRVIRLWNTRTGKLIRTLEGHRNLGIRCDFDSTGRWLLSNDWSAILRLWETSSGRQVLSFPAGNTRLFRDSPDDRIAVGKLDDSRRLQLLRVWGGAVYRTIVPGVHRCDARSYSHVTVHSEARLLAVPTVDAIALVDLATGTQVAELPAPAAPLCWEPTGALITARYPGPLTRWPVIASALPGLPTSHGGEPDGQIVRIGPPESLLAGRGRSHECGASADGQTIAVAQFDAGALVVHRSRPMKSLRLQPQPDVRNCSVSPDGRWVATGGAPLGEGSAAKVWDAATGTLIKALPVVGQCAVAFSPDGRWLLTMSGGCRLWKVGSWLEGPEIGGIVAAFSPDGRYIAVEAWSGVRLVEADTGREVVRLDAPEPMRFAPRSFTPDGAQIIAIGEDEAVHVWDLRTLRSKLAELGLDWDAPRYPSPPPAPSVTPPLHVAVDLGHLDPARRRELEEATAANSKALSLATEQVARRRDPAQAIELARKAVTLVPEERTFWNTLGVAYFRAGHWSEAITSLTKATELPAAELEGLDTFFLAMSHWQLGEKEKARQRFDQAVQWMDLNQELFRRDQASMENLRLARFEAEELMGTSKFAKAIKLHPELATAWSERGDAYARLRQWQKAIDDCSEAIKLDPRLTRAWIIRGDAYLEEGEWGKAATDYGQAMKLDPNDDWYWYPTAALRLQIGDTEGYRRICRDVLARFGNRAQLAERISKTCLLIPDAVSDLGEVFKLADRAVTGTEQHPYYRWYVHAKGLAEYRAGRDAGAVAWLTRFSPRADGVHSDAAAFSILAMAQQRLGRAEAAREALGHARAILTKKMPDPGAGRPFTAAFPFSAGDAHDWLHAAILFREAEAFVGADKKTNQNDTRKGTGSR
jgi:WD40 repeat protein/Flp pilus assembly protein TadD